MSILRAPRPETGWYALDKRISEDKRLGWAARGLLIYLLGKPDNWQVSIEDLRRQTIGARSRTGRDGIYGLLRELQEAGYITTVPQARREDGTLGPVEYVVREAPLTGQPDTAEPDTAQPEAAEPYAGQPDTAEPTQTKTDSKQGLKEQQGLSESEAPRKRGTRLPQDWTPDPSAEPIQLNRSTGDGFAAFWTAYPRRVSKPAAAKAWKAKKLDQYLEAILEDIERRKADAGQWTEPKFIPHPATYLNQRRWEDEWTPTRKPAGAITRDARSEEELDDHNAAELARFGLETAA